MDSRNKLDKTCSYCFSIILAPELSLFVTAVELYVLCEETFDSPA